MLPGCLDDPALATHEVTDGDVGSHVELDPVQSLLSQRREGEGGFAQRLRRNRARVDGGAARLLGRALDEADRLSK